MSDKTDLLDLSDEITDILHFVGCLGDFASSGRPDDYIELKGNYLATTFGMLEDKLKTLENNCVAIIKAQKKIEQSSKKAVESSEFQTVTSVQ